MEPMTVRGLDAGGTFDKPAGAKELSADSDRPERVKTIEAEMIQFEKWAQEPARALQQKHRLEEKLNELNSEAAK